MLIYGSDNLVCCRDFCDFTAYCCVCGKVENSLCMEYCFMHTIIRWMALVGTCWPNYMLMFKGSFHDPQPHPPILLQKRWDLCISKHLQVQSVFVQYFLQILVVVGFLFFVLLLLLLFFLKQNNHRIVGLCMLIS